MHNRGAGRGAQRGHMRLHRERAGRIFTGGWGRGIHQNTPPPPMWDADGAADLEPSRHNVKHQKSEKAVQWHCHKCLLQ